MTNQDWRAQAACRNSDVETFFPATEDGTGPAKAICATCPVQATCLEWALDTRQDEGVWGGLSESERRRLRRRRQAAERAA
ncbi:MAG: WhiB family transcriptional regulator [Acidimicrobiales bacterium]